LLSDIIGLEDFSGDMDFKVAELIANNRNSLDVKIDGLTDEMIGETLERAKVGRIHILEKMASLCRLQGREFPNLLQKLR